jgi:hypothetical protein
MRTLYPGVLDPRDRTPDNRLMLGKDAKMELIRSVPLFEDCSRKELREIAAAADEVVVPADYVLTKEGATGKELVVIVEGAADVRRRGRKINELGSGDFLGEIAARPAPRPCEPRSRPTRSSSPARPSAGSSRRFPRCR